MLDYILLIFLGPVAIIAGSVLGYFVRQNIAKFQIGSLEQTLQKRISEAGVEAQNIILEAKKKAFLILEEARSKIENREDRLNIFDKQLERKRGILEQKIIDFRKREKILRGKEEGISTLQENARRLLEQRKEELKKITGISVEEAKRKIIIQAEKDYQKEIQEKISKLEREGEGRFERKAKEILAFAVQRSVPSLIREFTIVAVPLPDDEIKGRIIGKEGRNIKAFENASGVEVIVDETPGVVFLSSFDPMRREIARISIERLIKDSRIQPSRIEEMVKKVETEMPFIIQKIGEEAAMDANVFGLDSKLHQILGRLKFRTSFGQNVLGHSLEVSFLSGAITEEMGADPKIARKAGLLHDIGKAVDSQIEGSHIEIGIRILQRFGIEESVIKAIRSHHEEYSYETLESIIIQTADAISASRPGARKDTTENYLKRLEDLEKIATSFAGVKTAYAIEAGREVRVFVKSEEVDDFGAKKLARDIAKEIETEIKYPGEIKVNIIRETRVVEYAR